MKVLAVCAIALGLGITGPAVAADNDNHDTTVHRTVHTTPHKRVVHTTRHTAHGKTVHRTVTTHIGKNGVDLTRYRRVVKSSHRFHVAAWNAPHGFTYRRFRLGERIPAVLLVSDFFLTTYTDYGLEAPPEGYVWVRDGNDAVLVDQDTGEVIEVQYDVFY